VALAELTVDQLRCIERAQLHLAPRLSLIYGENGSGKTSLLESMFLLGRGRSFRTRSSERLIRLGAPQLTVFGVTASEAPHRIGLQVSRTDGVRARVDGSDLPALAELSSLLPIQAIDPDVHKLVEEGSYGRRRWLD
jgi:DNA replication and repair protein RecF